MASGTGEKFWNALNEAPYLSFFGPTNAHNPSGCRASLFEHHTSCGMTCQLLKFIWSYLQLTCDVVKTGTLNLSLCHHDKLPWPLMQNWLLEKQEFFFLFTSAPLAMEHKYHNMGHSHVQLEEEISSDKEQLSMQLENNSVIWMECRLV